MDYRRNPLPRRPMEIFMCTQIAFTLPLFVIFKLTRTLPKIHDPGSWPYIFTFVTSVLMLLNTLANFIACMIIDTSVNYNRLKLSTEGTVELKEWRHCDACNRLAPPKSWHCKHCRTCILNSDHHCLFTGCCIGLKNHRYFLCFIAYLFVGSAYAITYNLIEIWTYGNYGINPISFHIMVPLPTIIGYYQSGRILYIIDHVATLCTFLALCLLCAYYLEKNVFVGVSKEKELRSKFAKIHYNLRNLLGERMHLAWICPLIRSPLPNNGYTWNNQQEGKGTMQK